MSNAPNMNNVFNMNVRDCNVLWRYDGRAEDFPLTEIPFKQDGYPMLAIISTHRDVGGGGNYITNVIANDPSIECPQFIMGPLSRDGKANIFYRYVTVTDTGLTFSETYESITSAPLGSAYVIPRIIYGIR